MNLERSFRSDAVIIEGTCLWTSIIDAIQATRPPSPKFVFQSLSLPANIFLAPSSSAHPFKAPRKLCSCLYQPVGTHPSGHELDSQVADGSRLFREMSKSGWNWPGPGGQPRFSSRRSGTRPSSVFEIASNTSIRSSLARVLKSKRSSDDQAATRSRT